MMPSPSPTNPADAEISIPGRRQYAELFGADDFVRFRVAGATGWDLTRLSTECAGLDRSEQLDWLIARCVTIETGGVGVESLRQLTVGDYHVVAAGVAKMTFGNTVELTQRCPDPACRTDLEWPLVLSQLIDVASTGRDTATFQLEGDDYAVRAATVGEARALSLDVDPLDSLVRACVEPDPTPIASSPDARKRIEAALEEADPLAEIAFSLPCVGCGTPFQTAVDPTRVLDELVQADDGRRDAEHHALALAYGWRPVDMLDLTPVVRRRFAATVSDRWAG